MDKVSNLKIAIVGAGGVGGYIGAKLSQHNYDVTLIARGKHYKAIKENGLKVIESESEDFTVDIRVENTLPCEPYDIIFIATKSYDFELACASIENAIDENTLIIPLSNGVEHKTTLSKYLSKGIICEGAVYIISHIENDGVIKKGSPNFYLLFGVEKEYEKLKALEEILNSCGLKNKYSANIRYDCWKKYIFISTMGSLTSYFKEPMGYIVEKHLELLVDVLAELKSVANKKGVEISDSDVSKALKQAKSVPYKSKTSMLMDFEKGKNTEVESLTGFIVKEAKKLGIEVPKMKMIYKALNS